jgi:hypothetical protein
VGALALALSVLSGLSGCHKVWRAERVQPPPLLGVGLEARTSLPATITVGDMELPRHMRLENSANFVVVSKDRLRVHVVLRARGEDLSDPRRWRVTLIDSLGRRFAPAGFDRREVSPVTIMFERAYVRSGERLPVEAQLNMLPLNGVTFFRGLGDYTFHRADIYRKDLRWMMLVLARPGYEYRYVWIFARAPDEAPAPRVVAARPAEL